MDAIGAPGWFRYPARLIASKDETLETASVGWGKFGAPKLTRKRMLVERGETFDVRFSILRRLKVGDSVPTDLLINAPELRERWQVAVLD